ncbi:DUF885 domain-containing protein [Marinibactrum halimedae]|uniref:DUF885 domain-containing protein n=1 Tax=Marinibactrum halimedae TaxID=1444977 RepID=A0AA37T2L6_9GAMM|nr:DUF885 domain-containing protein [Marinibactrum halimedae]MCD9459339.1 DUF885 domain-containing protein [Marinibactrum halimedae]GLS25769.1 hypothetical protein GCM10007877_14830 [Marinibactrum halimedae]
MLFRYFHHTTIAAITLLLSSIVASTHSLADDNAKFESLLADSWEHYLKHHPIEATDIGDHRYDDRLAPASLKDHQKKTETYQAFLSRLNDINVASLSEAHQLNYALFRTEIEQAMEANEHHSYLFNVNNRWGWHSYFTQLPTRLTLNSVEDYENYIQRLIDYRRYNHENMEVMREAIKKGYTHACDSMKGFEESIQAHIVKETTDSIFYSPFKNLPANLSVKKQKRLRKKAIMAIEQNVIPAFEEFYALYTNDYAPKCQTKPGALHWPNGKAYYEHRVRQYTTTSMTPEEVHQLGLSEVKRILGEMQTVMEEAEFEGSLQEFIHFLRTDSQFYPKTPEELVNYVSAIAKKMDGQLPKLFGHLPRQPYGIKEVPADIAPKTTAAYYSSGAPDGSRAGFYFINTSSLNSRPLYTMEALTLHEAVPGHHLQIALKAETDLPNFRRYGGYTVFIEGWALYSERLGLETGFYQDPYSNFGRLSYEMWRALRLVVDTGIHYLGWSRQQAIDFMAENSALSMHNITAEVDRYITWPGQALAYKIGELKIRELRQRAEKKLGQKFDLRSFHDELLRHGAVPISALEDIMDSWITAQKNH